jgi:hypothetical protein
MKTLQVVSPIRHSIAHAIQAMYCYACEKQWLCVASVEIRGGSAKISTKCKLCNHEVKSTYKLKQLPV